MTCPARLLDKTKLYHRTTDGIGRLYHVKIKIKGKNKNTETRVNITQIGEFLCVQQL